MAFGQSQGKDRAGIAGVWTPAVVNFHIQDLCVLPFDAADHIADVIQRFKLYIDVLKRGMFYHHVFHDGEIAHGKEDQHRS